MTRRMVDSAYPLAHPPAADVCAFYIGGDATNVWSMRDVARYGMEYGLPIFVRDHGGDPVADGRFAVAWANAHGQPPGTLIACDLETRVDTYVATFDQQVVAGGFLTLEYGSEGYIWRDPPTSGGRWDANPTGREHLTPGATATQWEFAGSYDLSDVDDRAPLWRFGAPPAPQPPRPKGKLMFFAKITGDPAGHVYCSDGVLFVWIPSEVALQKRQWVAGENGLHTDVIEVPDFGCLGAPADIKTKDVAGL